jgi:hypothetical protein
MLNNNQPFPPSSHFPSCFLKIIVNMELIKYLLLDSDIYVIF